MIVPLQRRSSAARPPTPRIHRPRPDAAICIRATMRKINNLIFTQISNL